MDIVILGLPMMYYIAMVAKVLVAFVFVLLTVAYGYGRAAGATGGPAEAGSVSNSPTRRGRLAVHRP